MVDIEGALVRTSISNDHLLYTGTSALATFTGGTHTIATAVGAAMFDLTGNWTGSETIDLGPTGSGPEDVTLELGTGRPVHGGTMGTPAALNASLVEVSSGADVTSEQFLKVDTALLEATMPLLKALAGSTLTLSGDAVTLANMAKLVAGSGLASAMIHLDASTMTIDVGSLVNVTGGTGGSYLSVLGDLIRLSNASILSLNGTDGYVLRVSGDSVVDIVGAMIDFVGSGNKVKLANTIAPDYVTLVGAVPVRLTGGATASQIEVLSTPIRGLGTAGTVENLSGGAFTGSMIEINGTAARVRIGR
jgi:hypothetical protein